MGFFRRTHCARCMQYSMTETEFTVRIVSVRGETLYKGEGRAPGTFTVWSCAVTSAKMSIPDVQIVRTLLMIYGRLVKG